MDVLDARARRAAIATIATIAACAAPILTAGPAAAQEAVEVDRTGDVWRTNFDEAEPTLAPHVTNGDVEQVTFAHDGRAVVVTGEFVDLAGTGQLSAFGYRARTNDKVYRTVFVESTPKHPEGRVTVARRDGDTVRACDASHSIDYEANTITVSVPRSCLRYPRWVQLTAVNYRMTRTAFVIDNPHNAGPEPRGWTDRLRRG